MLNKIGSGAAALTVLVGCCLGHYSTNEQLQEQPQLWLQNSLSRGLVIATAGVGLYTIATAVFCLDEENQAG